MRRFLLLGICLLLLATSANAVCMWGTIGNNNLPACDGFQDSHRNHWPRLPSDIEIGLAKDDFVDYVMHSDPDDEIRIDSVEVAKYHYCEGSMINHVEIETPYSWRELTAGTTDWQESNMQGFLVYSPSKKKFEFAISNHPSMYFPFPDEYEKGFSEDSCGAAAKVTTSPTKVATVTRTTKIPATAVQSLQPTRPVADPGGSGDSGGLGLVILGVMGILVIGAAAAGYAILGKKSPTNPGGLADIPKRPQAPPAAGAGTAQAGTQAATPNAVQDWIDSRTVYPGSWKVSTDGRFVYNDITGPLYPIPVDVITGVSPDPNEVAIFTTDIPKGDHAKMAQDVVDSIVLEDSIDKDSFRDFTTYNWNKNLRENPQKCQEAVKHIASVIGAEIGEKNVIVDFASGFVQTDGSIYPVPDAVFDSVTRHIVINPGSSAYTSPNAVVKTIAHEVKHQQQFNLNNPMENPTARNIATLNYGQYYIYGQDPGRYAGQYLENDANSFGEKVKNTIREEGHKNAQKDLFNFLDDLKKAQSIPREKTASFSTIDDVKRDPKKFLDSMGNSPGKVNQEITDTRIRRKQKEVFDFMNELRNAGNTKSGQPASPFSNMAEIKADPQGFLDHLGKNPGLKQKFIDIVQGHTLGGPGE